MVLNRLSMPFDIGYQLLVNGIPVGAVVHRIHRVRVIEVWSRMLDRHDNEARKILRGPLARLVLSETERCAKREVSLVVEGGITNVRMLVIPLGEQYGRADEYGMPPELGEQAALHFDSLDPLCLFRIRNRRDNLGHFQLEGLPTCRIQRDLLNAAMDIAGRAPPVLSFPLVHVHPDGMAVGTLEFGVSIQKGLNKVLARGQVFQLVDRVSER